MSKGQNEKFRSVKLTASDYDFFDHLSKITGHKIGYHLGRAARNYREDEGPVWEARAQEIDAVTKANRSRRRK